MAFEQLGLGPGLQSMTPATSSSGLVSNLILQQPCNPPTRNDWDRLFQPMFDEYFNPLTIIVSSVPIAVAPRAINSADSHVSTSIDQDNPSTSIPLIQDQEHSQIISQGFKESLKTPHFHDDPLYESLHEDLTSQGSSFNVRPIHTLFESLGRWTKNHPIENVIGDPSHSISTKEKLTDAMWCYFNAFLTFVEPKNFKQGTINMGLCYSKDIGMSLTAYANADHAGCQDTRRSTSGSAQFLDHAGCQDTRRCTSGSAQFLGDKLVSWSSKK
nr:hypothetical protein [Tanacetum cinerariifolium]